jgi:hypothetical protein
MATLKGLTIVAAFLAGGTSLAMAQNGLLTGGYPPVAGGAGGNTAVPGLGYDGYYPGAPGYLAAPGYVAPGHAVAPGNLYMSATGSRHKGWKLANRCRRSLARRDKVRASTGAAEMRFAIDNPRNSLWAARFS